MPCLSHRSPQLRRAVLWLCAAGTIVTSLAGCRSLPDIPVFAVDVQLTAQQRSWQAAYLLRGVSGDTTAVPTGREVHVPLGAAVRLRLASRDFVSDFAVADLALRDFAAPRLPSDFYFRADRVGRFEVRGDELCGLPHTDRTRGWLVIEDAAAYRAWVRRHIREEQE